MESKKMTVYIDPEVHLEIKISAAKMGKSMSEIAEAALKDWMKKYKKGE